MVFNISISVHTGEVYFGAGGTSNPVTFSTGAGRIMNLPQDADRAQATADFLPGDSTNVNLPNGTSFTVSEPSGQTALEISLGIPTPLAVRKFTPGTRV